MANIYDTYEYLGLTRGEYRWAGPNGDVCKNRDGTFYWQRHLPFEVELGSALIGTYPPDTMGTEDTWEMAVMRAESQEIPDNPLTADGWVW